MVTSPLVFGGVTFFAFIHTTPIVGEGKNPAPSAKERGFFYNPRSTAVGDTQVTNGNTA
jgi:hypothetical protein